MSKGYDYKCNICNKYFKTYKTIWEHNKKFHNDIKVDKKTDTPLQNEI